jgi:hypothetical protein
MMLLSLFLKPFIFQCLSEYVYPFFSLTICPSLRPSTWHFSKVSASVNGTNVVVLFHQHVCQKFAACVRLQLLHRALYFGAILPNAVATKIAKNYVRKSFSASAPKMLVKLTQLENALIFFSL